MNPQAKMFSEFDLCCDVRTFQKNHELRCCYITTLTVLCNQTNFIDGFFPARLSYQVDTHFKVDITREKYNSINKNILWPSPNVLDNVKISKNWFESESLLWTMICWVWKGLKHVKIFQTFLADSLTSMIFYHCFVRYW